MILFFFVTNMKLFLAYLHLLVFLSLTTSPPAIAKYAKTGCKDTCGNNVTIPYPFGIGAKCSVNKWYIVDCKYSTPYLPALNHVEILSVNLRNQTITVNMPRIFDCQNPVRNSSLTTSFDLDRSPFYFSRIHNKFVFEGCGNAVMKADNGGVLTGCTTSCSSDTLSDKNNCFGISCCETAIPHYFKSYCIDITGLEEEDGGSGSAFLVDETLYEQGRFSDPFSFKNASLIPVSILWTLTNSNQLTCCDKQSPTSHKVDIFNGTTIDVWNCNSYYYNLEDNPYLKDGCTAIPKYAKIGCDDKCGKVTIPYPFGVGANCSINKWYAVDCNSSTPYLPALNNLELLGVNLEDHVVNVSTRRTSYCQNPFQNSSEIMGVDLDSSPFWFSKSHNKFVFEGCGTAAMIDNGRVLTGCSTTCRNATHRERSNCFGIGCCETAIPHLLKSYTINLTASEDEDGVCGSAFLMEDEALYDKGRYSGPSLIPVSLTWTLTESDHVTCCADQPPYPDTVDEFNGTRVDTLTCYSSRSEGTGSPYLKDGCISPYGEDPTEECRRCRDSGGKCHRETAYDVEDFVFSRDFTCIQHDDGRSVILGVSISIGVLFFIAISYVLYKVIKKTKERRRRKRFFKRNGGLLLKQQEEADPSLVDKTIHFSSHELQKATDNFNENRIIGQGGQGTVYKGMLVDGRIVAVKKSKIVDESQLQQFINEVVVLSQINHRNVVKLLGCCLETDVPLLVSEFIANGTLYDRLHNETHELPISFDMRLQIATEVAGALVYLHSATSIPIYHRDIKTTNILLDDNYRAKVSDFGISRIVTIDQTHLTTLVKGTFGYFDPEYFQSSQFTEKSDVYSFGVVLVELLTGEKPISLTRLGEYRSLATYFTLAMEEGRVMSVFDATVIKEGTTEELLSAADLAMRCLMFNGKFRPTMKEVATELETMRRSHIPSTVQANTGSMVYGGGAINANLRANYHQQS